MNSNVSSHQLTTMLVCVCCIFLQNSQNAKQYLLLTANHSCWDWVRNLLQKEGENQKKEKNTTEDHKKKNCYK